MSSLDNLNKADPNPPCDNLLDKIARDAGIVATAEMTAFRDRVRAIAADYHQIIEENPCDVPGQAVTHTLSQRIDWADTNLLNPINKLLEALDPSNRHLLSLWPNEVDPDIMPDFDALSDQLASLQKLGWHLVITLSAYRRYKLPLGYVIQSQLVAEIAEVLDEYAPKLRPSRGTFDSATKCFDGRYPDTVRRLYAAITGHSDKLDRHIREAVERRR